jgi:hypothetical protein
LKDQLLLPFDVARPGPARLLRLSITHTARRHPALTQYCLTGRSPGFPGNAGQGQPAV